MELGVLGEIAACFVVIGPMVFFLAGNHKGMNITVELCTFLVSQESKDRGRHQNSFSSVPRHVR